ncbi:MULTISPECIES: hypothetical protein [Providencia]|nr:MULTISPECIES: hypothetical protein [Providencia]
MQTTSLTYQEASMNSVACQEQKNEYQGGIGKYFLAVLNSS